MLCDQVYQSAGTWFSSAPLVEHQYIAEQLLKLNKWWSLAKDIA
jgi:hypothetical protein